jgi:hypothetical protein
MFSILQNTMFSIVYADLCEWSYSAGMLDSHESPAVCGPIIKDTVNNGVAFLSHLRIDHGITYIHQRMAEEQTKSKREQNQLQI